MQSREYKFLPCSRNKYLQQKWKKAYDIHRGKVRRRMFLVFNVHQEAVKIQRENDRLEKKISDIMATPGRGDNRNDYQKKSLHKEKRQRELISISKQNQMIQFRLSQCKPHCSARKWHEDWLNTLKLRDRIGHYPRGSAKQQKVFIFSSIPQTEDHNYLLNSIRIFIDATYWQQEEIVITFARAIA
uniref:Uncharacterized protein n=1 Tax=Amphiprion percula TaxID=161767 RepID=A0A3P8RZC7_AMPPE